MSKDKIEVNMNVYDIPILVEALEEANKEIERLNNIINKGIEYINKFDDIRAYYEYIDEDGYDEYNFDEDFKKDMLGILKGEDKE